MILGDILKKKTFISIFLMLVSGFSGFTIGSSLESSNDVSETAIVVTDEDKEFSKASKEVPFSLYWQVWDTIKNEYYKQPVKDSNLFYGSLRGMVYGLGDPYSEFFEPKTAEEFQEELNGSFEGIGAEIGMKNDQVTIIAPLPDSPAEKAGIRAGDRVLAIDGIDTAYMTLDEAVGRIRGERGTSVRLTILPKGERDLFSEITVIRDVIEVKSVTFKTLNDDKIFYITLNHFNADTKEVFGEAVVAALSKNPKGIILDLRNNPGGFLDAAVKVAGYWTGNNTVVIEQFSSGDRNTYEGGVEPLLKPYKTVVLVNGGSASASEIVAGALKDYKLATIIGENTFGKGTVQSLETLPDGSAMKLTVAEWLTPNGALIEESGVTPDIIIERTEEDYDKDLDPQLDRAIEFLNSN